jgi:hypothetical protein
MVLNQKALISAAVGEYIPRESVWHGMYTGKVSLENFLRVDFREEVVDLAESLRALRITSGMNFAELNEHAGIGNTTLLAHLVNGSGERKNSKGKVILSYKDTRYPAITMKNLFPLSRGEEIRDGREARHSGRLPIVFYTVSGKLVLPKEDEMERGADFSYLENGIFFEEWMNFTSRLLKNRANFVKEKKKVEKLFYGEREIKEADFRLGRNDRLRARLRRISETLDVIPVYLVYPPKIGEREKAKEIINEHLRESYS